MRDRRALLLCGSPEMCVALSYDVCTIVARFVVRLACGCVACSSDVCAIAVRCFVLLSRGRVACFLTCARSSCFCVIIVCLCNVFV